MVRGCGRGEGTGGASPAALTHTPHRTPHHPTQIVVAMVGFYVALYGVVKVVKMAGGKAPEPEKSPLAAAVANATGGSVGKFGFEPPTLDSFDAWSENADNWKKWEEFISGPKLDLWVEGKL